MFCIPENKMFKSLALVGSVLLAGILSSGIATAEDGLQSMRKAPMTLVEGRGHREIFKEPLEVIRIRIAGMNTKLECKSNDDCEKGEICCKVSGLETYCSPSDECLGEPMKE